MDEVSLSQATLKYTDVSMKMIVEVVMLIGYHVPIAQCGYVLDVYLQAMYVHIVSKTTLGTQQMCASYLLMSQSFTLSQHNYIANSIKILMT